VNGSGPALAHARGGRSRAVGELMEFLRFPSVSADPARAQGVRRCADWIAEHLRSIGLDGVRVVETAGHPFVHAEWRQAPDRPTLLIYGHYDVQPPGPLERWSFPPFEPSIRGRDLFGRGASDDKGQLFAHVKAIESYLRASGRLPVNVRCVFDGEEEVGSPGLVRLLRARPKDLAADVAVVSDTRFLGPGRPAITHSLRGLLGFELTIRGVARELHAGHFGGTVRNPLEVFCDIVAGLHDGRGRVAVDGFYDLVRTGLRTPPTLGGRDLTEPEILRPAGIHDGWGEPGFSTYERATIRPALTVSSVGDGSSGRRVSARIPAAVSASLDVRLVPDQTPVEVERLLRRHVASAAPPSVGASLRTTIRVPPVVVDPRDPAVRAASRAYVRGFGVAPAIVRSGGSIPVVSAIHRSLGIPVVLMGFGLPDDNVHAPNEKLHLPNLFGGIETSIAFLDEVGMG
jgi:acetylornithine deacetylase/succinyl-diaminopimelate desuccinylase-like protein